MTSENRRILIIDDMPDIHSDFRKTLLPLAESELDAVEAALFGEHTTVSDHFELQSAFQGQEGYRKAADACATHQPFAMAFVDMRMPPGWDGVETVQRLWELDARLQVVICTAYSDSSWETVLESLKLSDRLLILKKPFDAIEVQQLARMLTVKWQLERNAEERRAALEAEVARQTERLSAVNDALRDDIAQRERVEAEQRVAASVYHVMADSVAILELDGTIRSVNPAFVALTGYPSTSVEGKSIALMSRLDEVDVGGERPWVRLLGNGIRTAELWSERVDGSRYLAKLKVVPLTGLTGAVEGHVCVFHDITEQRAREDRIRHMAFHDPLTGLANQTLLRDRLKRALALAMRNDAPLGLLFIDLDGFKQVNDTFGHAVGDALLIEVANRVEACVRDADTVARIGGDEFVVLLGPPGDAAGCGVVAEKIIGWLSAEFPLQGHAVCIGASIGIACFPRDGRTADALMKCADSAMYEAKAAGKGVYRQHAPADRGEAI